MKTAIWTFVFTTIALAIILVFAHVIRPRVVPISSDIIPSPDSLVDQSETVPSFETPENDFFTHLPVQEDVVEDVVEGAPGSGLPDEYHQRDIFVAMGCQVTGCSGQICANEGENIVSTCEWREQYACYKQPGSQCIQDEQGQCGWVMTEALQMCLSVPTSTE